MREVGNLFAIVINPKHKISECCKLKLRRKNRKKESLIFDKAAFVETKSYGGTLLAASHKRSASNCVLDCGLLIIYVCTRICSLPMIMLIMTLSIWAMTSNVRLLESVVRYCAGQDSWWYCQNPKKSSVLCRSRLMMFLIWIGI